MKIYISADIEGVTGATVWDEVIKNSREYPEFRTQMNREVAAACLGAQDAGADTIVVKDAHATARNIIAGELPEAVRLVRGWSQHPYKMMQELDNSFDAAVMIGYHSMAGSDLNPLAHTISHIKIAWMTVNDVPASEFLINAYTAALEKVPLVFISGDQGICDEARAALPSIQTVSVKQGKGGSTINVHPDKACKDIRTGVRKALESLDQGRHMVLPERFSVIIQFNECQQAYRAGFYPGARLVKPGRIRFESGDYFDVLRLLLFI